MSLCSRLRDDVETLRQADIAYEKVSRKKKVNRHELAYAEESCTDAKNALNDVVRLLKAQQVIPLSSVEEVKTFTRFLPQLTDRSALRRVVMRGRGNTRLSEVTNRRMRQLLLQSGFKAHDQTFDLPPVA